MSYPSRRNFSCYPNQDPCFVGHESWWSIYHYMGDTIHYNLDDTRMQYYLPRYFQANVEAAGCLDAGLNDYRTNAEC
jgi:hypothetical protein